MIKTPLGIFLVCFLVASLVACEGNGVCVARASDDASPLQRAFDAKERSFEPHYRTGRGGMFLSGIRRSVLQADLVGGLFEDDAFVELHGWDFMFSQLSFGSPLHRIVFSASARYYTIAAGRFAEIDSGAWGVHVDGGYRFYPGAGPVYVGAGASLIAGDVMELAYSDTGGEEIPLLDETSFDFDAGVEFGSLGLPLIPTIAARYSIPMKEERVVEGDGLEWTLRSRPSYSILVGLAYYNGF